MPNFHGNPSRRMPVPVPPRRCGWVWAPEGKRRQPPPRASGLDIDPSKEASDAQQHLQVVLPCSWQQGDPITLVSDNGQAADWIVLPVKVMERTARLSPLSA